MNSVLTEYMNISLMLTIIMTITVYSVGLTGFLKPFTKLKTARFVSGAVYEIIMLVFFLKPFEFSNLIAYALADAAAFSVFTLFDRKNKAQKLFLMFSFFSIRWFTGAISMALWLKLHVRISGLFTEWFADGSHLILMDIIFNIIEAVIIAGVMYVLIRIFHKVYISKNEKMSIKEALILILPSIVGVFSYRTALYFNSVDSADISIKTYDLAAVAFYIALYAVLIIVIYFYEQIKAAGQKEIEDAMLSVQTENIRDYISGAENLYRDIRAIRHDMRNHLTVLQRLHMNGENEAFEKYLGEVSERIDADAGENSGNPVSDIIISEKRNEAEKRGIMFESDFHYPDGLRGHELDMSIILNNALNNAIEAAEKCPEDNRFISLKSCKKKNAFLITIRNSCCEKQTVTEGELLKTTKPNSSDHGFGLVNIKNTAEKYHGGIDFSFDEREFTLSVMLMM